MTSSQKDLFIKMAQCGMACGLFHPYEWYMNYVRVSDEFANHKLKAIDESFLEFLHGCGSYPDDPIENWTRKDLDDAISSYYEDGGRQSYEQLKKKFGDEKTSS